jgi:hypothetical protein
MQPLGLFTYDIDLDSIPEPDPDMPGGWVGGWVPAYNMVHMSTMMSSHLVTGSNS